MLRTIAVILLLICAAELRAQTTDNDDSCDIGIAPAATLLIPYFEIDMGANGGGRTTVFSVTNVSPYSQIARVTLWTDWAFPVLTFNIYLTGYDVQPINLYDVIARGIIGDLNGTSTGAPNASASTGRTPNLMGSGTSSGTNGNTGSQPFLVSSAQGNPNFLSSATNDCAPGRLPGVLPARMATDVRALLTTGRSTGAGITCPGPEGEEQVGGNHGGTVAIGYATIDVVATCSNTLPIQIEYFTHDILFDNVLIGDYANIDHTRGRSYAGGSAMVHIRAIPEGGPASAPAVATNLPFTFYDRFLSPSTGKERTFDRRQPLPSAFAARWISGSKAGFETQYKIWREGFTTGDAGGFAACSDYEHNSDIPVTEVVRFDERENAGIMGLGLIFPFYYQPNSPATLRQSVTGSFFPIVAGSTDVGGWLYLNLASGGDGYTSADSGAIPYNATRPGFGAGNGAAGKFPRDVGQSWVTLSMFFTDSESPSDPARDGVDYDAAWLGNGCSFSLPVSVAGFSGSATGRIAPAGGVLVCPGGVTTVNIPAVNAQCKGSNLTP